MTFSVWVVLYRDPDSSDIFHSVHATEKWAKDCKERAQSENEKNGDGLNEYYIRRLLVEP